LVECTSVETKKKPFGKDKYINLVKKQRLNHQDFGPETISLFLNFPTWQRLRQSGRRALNPFELTVVWQYTWLSIFK